MDKLHNDIVAWMQKKRNRDVKVGAGLWDRVKSFGKSAITFLKDKLGPAAKKTFRALANAYRAASGNPIVRPLLEGEINYGLHNFTGPGTRVDIPAIANAQPYNGIDAVSKVHDLDYLAAGKIADKAERAKAIHEADRKAIIGYNKYPNDNGYSAALAGIAGKFGLEQALSAIKQTPSTIYGSGLVGDPRYVYYIARAEH